VGKAFVAFCKANPDGRIVDFESWLQNTHGKGTIQVIAAARLTDKERSVSSQASGLPRQHWVVVSAGQAWLVPAIKNRQSFFDLGLFLGEVAGAPVPGKPWQLRPAALREEPTGSLEERRWRVEKDGQISTLGKTNQKPGPEPVGMNKARAVDAETGQTTGASKAAQPENRNQMPSANKLEPKPAAPPEPKPEAKPQTLPGQVPETKISRAGSAKPEPGKEDKAETKPKAKTPARPVARLAAKPLTPRARPPGPQDNRSRPAPPLVSLKAPKVANRATALPKIKQPAPAPPVPTVLTQLSGQADRDKIRELIGLCFSDFCQNRKFFPPSGFLDQLQHRVPNAMLSDCWRAVVDREELFVDRNDNGTPSYWRVSVGDGDYLLPRPLVRGVDFEQVEEFDLPWEGTISPQRLKGCLPARLARHDQHSWKLAQRGVLSRHARMEAAPVTNKIARKAEHGSSTVASD
jgi:hypothetical protein